MDLAPSLPGSLGRKREKPGILNRKSLIHIGVIDMRIAENAYAIGPSLHDLGTRT